jgi:hypothetical protein
MNEPSKCWQKEGMNKRNWRNWRCVWKFIDTVNHIHNVLNLEWSPILLKSSEFRMIHNFVKNIHLLYVEWRFPNVQEDIFMLLVCCCWCGLFSPSSDQNKNVVSPWTNHQNDDNKNEWTKEIDVVLEQKYEKDIIDTGNHNRNVLY